MTRSKITDQGTNEHARRPSFHTVQAPRHSQHTASCSVLPALKLFPKGVLLLVWEQSQIARRARLSSIAQVSSRAAPRPAPPIGRCRAAGQHNTPRRGVHATLRSFARRCSGGAARPGRSGLKAKGAFPQLEEVGHRPLPPGPGMKGACAAPCAGSVLGRVPGVPTHTPQTCAPRGGRWLDRAAPTWRCTDAKAWPIDLSVLRLLRSWHGALPPPSRPRRRRGRGGPVCHVAIPVAIALRTRPSTFRRSASTHAILWKTLGSWRTSGEAMYHCAQASTHVRAAVRWLTGTFCLCVNCPLALALAAGRPPAAPLLLPGNRRAAVTIAAMSNPPNQTLYVSNLNESVNKQGQCPHSCRRVQANFFRRRGGAGPGRC